MMAQPRFSSRDESQAKQHEKMSRNTHDGHESDESEERENTASTLRPTLVRAAPGRLTEIHQTSNEDPGDSADTTASGSDSDVAPDQPRRPRMGSPRGSGKAQMKNVGTLAHTPEEVARLREVVIMNQHRTRADVGALSPFTGSKRVSPIKEEGSPEPSSLDSVMHGEKRPSRTTSTVSTASTESQRTVRGSTTATPAIASENLPMRTPSYPFPYIPGTPRPWPGVHQPFTTLSPTTSYRPTPGGKGSISASDNPAVSGASTPRTATFPHPTEYSATQPPDDPRFPTPDLYDMILSLNAEPGIERWWTAVSNILHDHFAAERATTVVPMDATDIENVPWGLRATFDIAGKGQPVGIGIYGQASQPSKQDDQFPTVKPQKLHPERFRPRLESRHSYAGHGREVRDVTGTPIDQADQPLTRPPGLRRNVTHQPGMESSQAPGRLPTTRTSSTYSVRNASLSDAEFSSVSGDADSGPHAEVFTRLAAIDREEQPLIEAAGINRVLKRAKVVTVIRDYASGAGDDDIAGRKSGNAGNGDEIRRPKHSYDEYEQHEESPWTQSPGPSPAIQADEDRNPFFASENQQVEDSFTAPVTSPEDYSRLAPSAAVGVDHANCVIHVPLIHPTLSQAIPSLSRTPQASQHSYTGHTLHGSDVKKAPIAIISILCPIVPYPANLLYTLRMLGPHLATSYSTAIQFSATQPEAVSIRHRRTASGNLVMTSPLTIMPLPLEDIMNVELERTPGVNSEVMASPSDYSGRSRHSPSSVLGTPGWDTAMGSWTASRSLTSTPASISTHEIVDNYFESKKKSSRSTSNADSKNRQSSTKSARSSMSHERSSKNSTSETPSRHEQRKMRSVSQSRGKDEAVPSEGEMSQPTRPGLTSQHRSSMAIALSQPSELNTPRPHSLLHSYGADFQASFGLPSSGTVGEPRTPFEHFRKTSFPEDMPPPSERLLRTIIDSVPVQIFTAQPETGNLTWVNSKFLIYRGQDARQVLVDPWRAIHPTDRDAFSDLWQRSLHTNQQMQQKVRLQRFDGEYRWFYVRAAPLKDKNLKVVHWIGTMMDFHEQHIAEQNSARQQETAKSEAKYRALANSSPQIVFAVNSKAGVTFCNSQWVHYSGQSEARALGVGFMDHVHPDDLVKCRLPKFEGDSNQATNVPTSLPAEPKRSLSSSADSSSGSSETATAADATTSPVAHLPQRKLSELARTGILKVTRDADGRPSYSTEVRLKSKDGVYRWHLVRVLRAEPILQNDDEEGTWYGTCTDINDHKTLERDLKETMDEKSRFLSNMSHEIRTPLNGITGMVNFLIDSNLNAEQMEHVNIIRASTEGLRGLINDILDLSKAEAGMIQLNIDWMYIRALIEEINDLTSTMAIDKGLELNYIVEEDVPTQIKGDRFRIRQILLNVIGNAIKFTQQGEVFVRCSIQADEDGELAENEMFIKFEVIDTGRGFNEKEAEFLFKRFSQIDGSSTRQHGGTGLGLVISRQLAQLHGGDMSARAVPDKGSTFTFFIKTAIPSQEDQPPPPMTPGPTTIPILPGAAITPSGSIPSGVPRTAGTVRLLAQELTESPVPYAPSSAGSRISPVAASPASSGPSVHSADRNSSGRSERSSASSFVPEVIVPGAPITLAMPKDTKLGRVRTSGSESSASSSSAVSTTVSTLRPGALSQQSRRTTPPMFSILVIAPLKYSREATVQHIDKTLPRNVPHQITSRESLADCQQLLGGDEPVFFTHVVVVLHDIDEIVALMRQVFNQPNSTTALVLITDLAQRRKISEHAPDLQPEQLIADRRLLFVFKPLKPSRLGIIFDPQKERELSTDRNQDSAQQVAVNQKQVFDELFRRLGHKSQRVLLVEDNRINQMVILKYLRKVSIEADTALDGVQCTEKVFSKPPGHYAIVLCDLHMPNKDGYQTCREIRAWEKKNAASAVKNATTLPIIALSANVLGDVYQKCVDAGFNSYLTKPVDFKELSTVLITFMDPADPHKPLEFMKGRRKSARPVLH